MRLPVENVLSNDAACSSDCYGSTPASRTISRRSFFSKVCGVFLALQQLRGGIIRIELHDTVVDRLRKTRKNAVPCAVIIREWRARSCKGVSLLREKRNKVSQSNESEVDKNGSARCLAADGCDPTADADGACGGT